MTALSAGAGPPVGVAVDYDRAVWLPGPLGDEADAWAEGALRACVADFGVEPGSDAETYLRDLLTAFATEDLACDFRFLRLRGVSDARLVAMLTLHVGMAAGELEEALHSFEGDSTYYDVPPQIEFVDAERGLRRALAFTVDDGIRSVVRYHRRVEEWAADILMSCAGADLNATALGLADLDGLARAVWLVDAAGRRR